MQQLISSDSTVSPVAGDRLRKELVLQSEKCIDCKLCRKECAFLQKYGSPKHIADTFNPASPNDQMMAFECSLCGLCAAVCPVKIDPSAMFLEMRRQAAALGTQDFSDYGGILNYEKRGTSRRYSYYALPEACDTILFPGCTLPGTRPDTVKALYDHLRTTIPGLGIVLDCCTKPSHDLGREQHFQAMFGEMRDYLLRHGVKNILVACPNCYKVFKRYSGNLQVKTVYEHLAATSLPATATLSGTVSIHDPCATRNEERIHADIRRIAAKKALTVQEMKHHGPETLCCGEGGSVGCLNPDYAKRWGTRRKEEAGGVRILTYCAGCAHVLGSLNPTSHILDFLFAPEATLTGNVKISKAPWTYLNRLGLKSHFKKQIPASISRERTYTDEKQAKGGMLKRIVILLALISVIIAVRMTGTTQYMEPEKLRALIQGYGMLAPVMYMLAYTVAPALFLPGLPITLVGGILFGPFWGVIYTIIGSTAGACVAFLVSRSIGRQWIEGKLRSPRWKKLDEMVENHGWKAVAFTRLVPLFPFNLLNYAFGLTKVKFLHYALATFICMLPACIAFIVFSSSLLSVLRGKMTPEFLVGLTLIIAVSLLPIVYRTIKLRSEEKRAKRSGDPTHGQHATASGAYVYNIRKSLIVKAMIIAATVISTLTVVSLIHRYMYILDSYVYTGEFHLLFIKNNLHAAKLGLVTEYLKSMSFLMALPLFMIGTCYAGLDPSSSKLVLIQAATHAFGAPIGFLFGILGFLVLGLLAFGLGSLFFGDIVPLVMKERYAEYLTKLKKPALTLFPLMFALPFVPIAIVAVAGGISRVPFFRMARYMLIGFAIQTLVYILM